MWWWEFWHFQKFWYTQLFLVRERKNKLCYSIWPISFYENLCSFSGFLNSRIVRLMSLSQNYERRDTTAVKYFDDSLREIFKKRAWRLHWNIITQKWVSYKHSKQKWSTHVPGRKTRRIKLLSHITILLYQTVIQTMADIHFHILRESHTFWFQNLSPSRVRKM